jgi:nitrogen fixation protein FixH
MTPDRTSQHGRFTGRHMLAIMLAFFGVIIAVNVTMATVAGMSWTGFVVRSSYVAGLEFDEKVAAARKQRALGWSAALSIAGGEVALRLVDATGTAVPLRSATLTLRSPVSDARDRTIDLSAGVAALDIADGAWIADVQAETRDGTPWREARRIHVREGRLQ